MRYNPGTRTQQISRSKTDNKRDREKFYAWLGEIKIVGMTQEDLNRAQTLFNQGISAKQMIAELEKPYRRKP